MNRLEVLIATMKQEDFSLLEKMNVRCSAVIANQHDKNEISFKQEEYGCAKMITTDTRGVGLNRNIALMASSADILLFADDDVTYYDGSLAGVCQAFEELPQADVIIFSVDHSKNGEVYEKVRLPIRKLHWWNSMRYGTYVVAIRRQAVLSKNITFNQLFGGGCQYGCGEDSLFIMDCFKNRLNVYSHGYVLGVSTKDESTWFCGYDKKYFHDKGVLFAFLFPCMKWIMFPVFAVRMKMKLKPAFSLWEVFRLMMSGVKSAKKTLSYKG